MDNVELIDSFLEFKELKNIDKQTMQNILKMFSEPYLRGNLIRMNILISL